jgi:predicted nucleic acid-binding protein
MTTFVDTSALIALLDGSESKHTPCARAWRKLLADDESLVTSSYVLVETYALAQRRLGIDAVRTLTTDYVPLLAVDWIDETVHGAGLASLLTANRRELSLVDCVSFEIMRRRDISKAFTLDADFAKQGFNVTP